VGQLESVTGGLIAAEPSEASVTAKKRQNEGGRLGSTEKRKKLKKK